MGTSNNSSSNLSVVLLSSVLCWILFVADSSFVYGFVPPPTTFTTNRAAKIATTTATTTTTTSLTASRWPWDDDDFQENNNNNNKENNDAMENNNNIKSQNPFSSNFAKDLFRKFRSARTGLALSFSLLTLGLATTTTMPPPAMASDGAAIAMCLFQKCQLPLAKCVANPKCLANVICINTCANRPDELGCQIKCGDLFENDVVGEFNKCAVSDMDCVPQAQDDGSYPIPAPDQMVSKFDTKLFNGRWYITAGQNPLFDIFPCQVHFFTETAPGKFFGKLNWRIDEPDGEFFTRDALQRFVQDPQQPGHLINHDNEYLHYKDDWYVLDYEYDNNKDGVPPFCFVYYRGSNDAWDGYGGAVIYTRDAKLPESIKPRLREAAKKVHFDFDKDFALTDNTCRESVSGQEALLLREKFAGKVALQTEQQVQAQATKLRGNAVNSVKAQKLFVLNEFDQAERAVAELAKSAREFEREVVDAVEEDVEKVVEVVEKDVEKVVETVEKDVEKVVETVEKDVEKVIKVKQ